jgi:dihydroflavonol-4-reductase
LNSANLNEVLPREHFDSVVHAAALIHIGWSKREESLTVNRDGTRRVLEWAQASGTRAIYVSTVNCLPTATKSKGVDETASGPAQPAASYIVSKRAGQQVCDELISQGSDCYAVYPGFLLGPNDWQLSSGRMVMALQSFCPWSPLGGCSVCDPRDVAEAILRIAKQGAPQRHYILAGQNISYFHLWKLMAKRLGAPPPLVAIRKPTKLLGQWVANAFNAFRKNESDFNSVAIELAQLFHYYDSTRAKQDLNYTNRPMEQSIADSIAWLYEHGHLPKYARRLKSRIGLESDRRGPSPQNHSAQELN